MVAWPSAVHHLYLSSVPRPPPAIASSPAHRGWRQPRGRQRDRPDVTRDDSLDEAGAVDLDRVPASTAFAIDCGDDRVGAAGTAVAQELTALTVPSGRPWSRDCRRDRRLGARLDAACKAAVEIAGCAVGGIRPPYPDVSEGVYAEIDAWTGVVEIEGWTG